MHPTAGTHVKEVVWYVEARSTKDVNEAPRMGSAVAIELKLGSGDTTRKYLLSCAHIFFCSKSNTWFPEIICQKHANGYSHLDYRKDDCWPNHNDKNEGLFLARINNALSAKTIDEKGNSVDIQNQPGQDWVILEVLNEGFQELKVIRSVFEIQPRTWTLRKSSTSESESTDALPAAADDGIDSGGRKRKVWPVGYPYGKSSWKNGDLIECFISNNPLVCKRMSRSPQILMMQGSETRAGMSGGGLFTNKGSLAGLHRSSELDGLVKGSIRIAPIFDELQRRGYLPVLDGPVPGVRWPAWILQMDRIILLRVLFLCMTTGLILALILINQNFLRPEKVVFDEYAKFQLKLETIEQSELSRFIEQINETRVGGWDMWIRGIEDGAYVCAPGPNDATDKKSIRVTPPKMNDDDPEFKIRDLSVGRILRSVNGTLKFEDGKFKLFASRYEETITAPVSVYIEAVTSSALSDTDRKDKFRNMHVYRWRATCTGVQKTSNYKEYLCTVTVDNSSHNIEFVSNEPWDRGSDSDYYDLNAEIDISGKIKLVTKEKTRVHSIGY